MYPHVTIFLWLLYCNTVTSSAVKLTMVDKPTRTLQKREIAKIHLLAKESVGKAKTEPLQTEELGNIANVHLYAKESVKETKPEPLRKEELDNIARIHLIPMKGSEKSKTESLRKERLDSITKMHLFAKENSEEKIQSETKQERAQGDVHSSRKITVDVQGAGSVQDIAFGNIPLISKESGSKVEGLVVVGQEKVVDVPNKKSEFKPLPFPVDFRFYDVNKDGRITLHELEEITGTAENVQKAFAASDINGDGFVTQDEYGAEPWGYRQGDVVLQD